MAKDTKFSPCKPSARGTSHQNKSRVKREKDFKPSTRQAFSKFKENTPELEGYIFDCSDNKQADRYVTSMKRIAEHVGTNFRNGGDICSTIEQVKRYDIPKPTAPSSTNDEVDKMILTKKVDSYVKRDGMRTSKRAIPLFWANGLSYSSRN